MSVSACSTTSPERHIPLRGILSFTKLDANAPVRHLRVAALWEDMIQILIDADACPVKEETYRVAARYKIPVVVVSNSPIRVPRDPLISRKVVSDAFDAADDWIVEHVASGVVVITADILLADRCLKLGATVIAPSGKPFTSSSIGGAIATRAIMADLRAGGDIVGGPPPFSNADRSRFLSRLDETLVKLQRQS